MPKIYRQIAITVGAEEADEWTKLAKSLGISRTEMFRRAVNDLARNKEELATKRWLVIHHDDQGIFELLTVEAPTAEFAHEQGARFFHTDLKFVHVRSLDEVAVLGWGLAVGELG